MNCPYCKKRIEAMTGFQEARKFQTHLRKCKKNPAIQTIVDEEGDIWKLRPPTSLLDALNIRAESGQ